MGIVKGGRGHRVGAWPGLGSSCAVVALAALPLWVAAAQDSANTAQAPAPTPAPTPTPTPTDPERDPPGTIVVIGDRAIIASLKDLAVEQTYDEDAVGSYAAGSIGEVLDAIREENGDEDPTILVNGRPVADASDISDLPPEAIARIETLPRGSAQRVNGAPGQRAYNVVLKRQVRTAIVTASDEFATEGGWNNIRGEVQLTRIQGQNRLNLSLRGADSGYLLESERAYVPRGLDLLYSPGGNILPTFGASQVDPVLSALAGRSVTSVALPAGVTTPTYATLLPGVNALNPSARSLNRSLRGAAQPIDLSLSGSQQLADRLSLSFNARANWNVSRSLTGLPRARITVPAGNAFSPFSVPVSLYIEDPTRPLTSRSKSDSQSLSTTLNAEAGTWRGTFNARYDRRAQDSAYAFSGGLPVLTALTNPFDASLAALIPITGSDSSSVSQTTLLGYEASGPLAALWAGPLEARIAGGVQWDKYNGSSPSGDRSFKQRQIRVGGGLTLPLTSRDQGVLAGFGDSELAFDIGWIDLDLLGTLKRNSLAFNWQPTAWLRVVARATRDESAISPVLLAAPTTTIQDVPYFDPLTGDTVEVTSVYGGFAGLLPEDRRTRSVALTATPWKLYNMQLDAEYTVQDLRNQIGALPDPTTAVLAAFPDRFVRNASGTLVLVDNRSINLTQQRTERLRFGLRYTLPLSAPGRTMPAADGRPGYRTPQTKLQVTMSHTELLSNTSVIRPGLPEIDLLKGAAVGFGGSEPRGVTSASFAFTRGLTGVRFDFRRRGESDLLFGTAANPQLLRFGALTTLDARAYTDLGEVFRGSRFAKGTRVTVSIDNAFNRRQSVIDEAGFTPQAYQPMRRDALGRTIMFELRKSF